MAKREGKKDLCKRGRPPITSAPPKRQFGQELVAKGFADGKVPSVTETSGKIN